MKTLIVSYGVALVVLAILDAFWLDVVSRDFCKARLGQGRSSMARFSVSVFMRLPI